MREQLVRSLKSSNRSLNKYVQKAMQRQVPNKRAVIDSRKLVSAARNDEAFRLTNVEEVKSAMKYAGRARWLSRGCVALDVVLDGPAVYNTYEEGGDWQAEALDDAATIGGAYLVGEAAAGAAFMLIAPVGWVVILVGAGASIGATYLIKKLFETG